MRRISRIFVIDDFAAMTKAVTKGLEMGGAVATGIAVQLEAEDLRKVCSSM